MSRLMFMLLICPTVAFAQGQLPNEVDLKAAYCIPIVRERVENPLNPEKYPESARKELQDLNGRNAINLRRLNLYLLELELDLPRFDGQFRDSGSRLYFALN